MRLTVTSVYRVEGGNRYETALEVAETMARSLSELHGKAVDTVVIASGSSFPDALAGSTLAAACDAPILLVGKTGKGLDLVLSFIEDLPENGKVYILGGTGAVPATVESALAERRADLRVKRLAGSNRYETNLKILEETGKTGGKLLVCSGAGYADALAASALGLPLLIVKGKSLTAEQKSYLRSTDYQEIYILGGTGSVAEGIQTELGSLFSAAKIQRIAGDSRYKTSVAIAEAFFEDPERIVVATGVDYPDGLTGGALAYALGAPLLLVSNTKYTDIAPYTKSSHAGPYYILGGTGSISDKTVTKIVPGYQ